MKGGPEGLSLDSAGDHVDVVGYVPQTQWWRVAPPVPVCPPLRWLHISSSCSSFSPISQPSCAPGYFPAKRELSEAASKDLVTARQAGGPGAGQLPTVWTQGRGSCVRCGLGLRCDPEEKGLGANGEGQDPHNALGPLRRLSSPSPPLG